ncbi:hypothetical protein MHH93_00800 [Priestia sp. FSL H7-0729]
MDSLSDVFMSGVVIILIFMMFYFAFMFLYAMVINIINKIRPPSKLMSCKSCEREISRNAYVCPYCGQHYGSSSALDSIIICLFCGIICLLIALASSNLMLEEYGYDLLSVIKKLFD